MIPSFEDTKIAEQFSKGNKRFNVKTCGHDCIRVTLYYSITSNLKDLPWAIAQISSPIYMQSALLPMFRSYAKKQLSLKYQNVRFLFYVIDDEKTSTLTTEFSEKNRLCV
jgi:hypothetical protein